MGLKKTVREHLKLVEKQVCADTVSKFKLSKEGERLPVTVEGALTLT